MPFINRLNLSMHYLFISAQKVRLAIKGMLKNISKTAMKEEKGKDQIRFTHFKKLKGVSVY